MRDWRVVCEIYHISIYFFCRGGYNKRQLNVEVFTFVFFFDNVLDRDFGVCSISLRNFNLIV